MHDLLRSVEREVSCAMYYESNHTGSKNGFMSIDPTTLEIKGRWETEGHHSDYGYDFW